MKKNFDPTKHGMIFCPLCNGDGEAPEDSGGSKVCVNCGGFGLIRDGREGSPRKQIAFRDKYFLLPE